jgi:hypothetical protein
MHSRLQLESLIRIDEVDRLRCTAGLHRTYCTAYERSASGADTLQRADTKSAQLRRQGCAARMLFKSTQSGVYTLKHSLVYTISASNMKRK